MYLRRPLFLRCFFFFFFSSYIPFVLSKYQIPIVGDSHSLGWAGSGMKNVRMLLVKMLCLHPIKSLVLFKPVLSVSCIHVEMSSVVFYSISGITMKLKGKTREWIIPHESRTDIIAGPDVGNSIDADGVLEWWYLNMDAWPILHRKQLCWSLFRLGRSPSPLYDFVIDELSAAFPAVG